MSIALALLACAGLFLAPAAAQAGTVTYTASGATNDGALGGTAVFTFTTDTITIHLTSSIGGDDLRSQGQALSSLSFTLGTPPSSVSVTGATASGTLIDIGSGGSVTSVSGNPSRWISTSGGDLSWSGHMITLAVAGNQVSGGNPSEMIVGPPDSNGVYANANPGGATNGHFDPYTESINDSATFVLTVPGVTSDTTVTDATFGFGTGPDKFLPGTLMPPDPLPPPPPLPVPEPSSLALAGIGLAGLAMAWRLRWRRVRKA